MVMMVLEGWLPAVRLVALSSQLALMPLLVLQVALPYRGVFLVSPEHPYQIVAEPGVRGQRIRHRDGFHWLYLVYVPVLFVAYDKALEVGPADVTDLLLYVLDLRELLGLLPLKV